VERFYRVIFLGLFILGFIGAVASADHDGNGKNDKSSVESLIRDVRLAQQINDLNEGRWNQDVGNLKEDGLARVEDLLGPDGPGNPSEEPPLTLTDQIVRSKSELAQ